MIHGWPNSISTNFRSCRINKIQNTYRGVFHLAVRLLHSGKCRFLFWICVQLETRVCVYAVRSVYFYHRSGIWGQLYEPKAHTKKKNEQLMPLRNRKHEQHLFQLRSGISFCYAIACCFDLSFIQYESDTLSHFQRRF